ncbi:uncharacterized protein LOC132720427 [Ruditapes philippinarum]|uniref:uncharacterized protein LOC132720427 n=1 Tax=Ruditapes philippinarum TaxID=129788 RepID=UPI00295BB96B|nr:uncharacterized protein LOC132720427 [Ruditapes philippinarum]
MAITGNLSGKSKAANTDEYKEDKMETSTDLNSDEDSLEQDNKFVKDSVQLPVKSDIDLDTAGLQLLEEELSFAEESIQRFLLSTIGYSCSKVYDIIFKYGQKLLICSNNSILRKSATGNAIFVLLTGKVNVLTSDKSEVLSTLSPGEVFGEVSLLFDIPVTANIVAVSDVTVVKLPKQATYEIFQEHTESLDMIDWFIQRRYLPTGSSVDSGRVYRRLALQTLKHIHLLDDWTEEMIKKLILSFDKNIVTLYPCKSIIILENDPLTAVYIVLKGDIEIVHGSKIINTRSITNEKDPFVFTEITLISDGKTSPVTIKALTNCQVIQVSKELVRNILESFPKQLETFNKEIRSFRDSFKRLGHVYIQNEAYLHIEMLVSYLKENSLYATSSIQQLWRSVLASDVQEFEDGMTVLLETDSVNYEAILIVRGSVIQKSTAFKDLDTTPKAIIYRIDGENVVKNTDQDPDGLDAERGDCKLIDDSNYTVFRTGSVVDIKSLIVESANLRTKTNCLILKIRRAEACSDTEQPTKAFPIASDTENSLSMV